MIFVFQYSEFNAIIYFLANVLVVFYICQLVITGYEDGRWDGRTVERNGVALGEAIVVPGEAVVLHELTHVSDVFQARAALCFQQIRHSFGIPSTNINAWTKVQFFGAAVIQICAASLWGGPAYPNLVLEDVFNELVWFVAVFAADLNKVKAKDK